MKYRNALLATTIAVLLSPLAMSAEEAGKKAAEEKPQKVESVECETVTGSRIKAARPAKDKAGKCAVSSSPTRTYSKDQIDMTGETDIADALRKLDPAFH
jgi:outer membrane receptor for monomeric catechols